MIIPYRLGGRPKRIGVHASRHFRRRRNFKRNAAAGLLAVVAMLFGARFSEAQYQPVVWTPPLALPESSMQKIFVSPAGNDASDGSMNAPLRSLEAARDLAVRMNSKRASRGVIVFLRDGWHQLLQPLTFLSSHSGRSTAPIVFRSFPGERAHLTGALSFAEGSDGFWSQETIHSLNGPIAAWKFTFSGEARSTLESALARMKRGTVQRNGQLLPNNSGAFGVTQLFVNDRRAIRTRHPNIPVRGDTRMFETVIDPRCPFEAPQAPGFWVGFPREVTEKMPGTFLDGTTEVVFNKQWESFRALAAGAFTDPVTGHVFYKLKTNLTKADLRFPGYWCGVGYEQGADEPVWFENNRAFLDARGEWFLDESALELFYLPFSDSEDVKGSVFSMPLNYTLIQFSPEVRQPAVHLPLVHDLYFQRIDFLFSNWRYTNFVGNSEYGFENQQGGRDFEGAIDGSFVDRIVIEDCVFRHLGAHAIALGGWRLGRAMGEQTSNVFIRRNVFSDIGGGAVFLDNIRRSVTNFTVTGNDIRFTGQVFPNTVGINIAHGSSSLIMGNIIEDVPYSGVIIGNNTNRWAKTDRHIVRANRVTRAMSFLRDGGGIYISTSNGIVSENIIEKTGHYRWPGAAALILNQAQSSTAWPFACALYFDSFAHYWTGTRNFAEQMCGKSPRLWIARKPGLWAAFDVFASDPAKDADTCRSMNERDGCKVPPWMAGMPF